MNTLYGLNFNEYQRGAVETAIYPDAGEHTVGGVVYTALGLAGEAGEVANKVKKILRDDDGELSEQRREELVDEASDCLWYLATLLEELNCDFSYAAEHNLKKLRRRASSGTLNGSGDNR